MELGQQFFARPIPILRALGYDISRDILAARGASGNAISSEEQSTGGTTVLPFKKTKKLSQGKRLERTNLLGKVAKMEWSRTSAMETIRSKSAKKK